MKEKKGGLVVNSSASLYLFLAFSVISRYLGSLWSSGLTPSTKILILAFLLSSLEIGPNPST